MKKISLDEFEDYISHLREKERKGTLTKEEKEILECLDEYIYKKLKELPLTINTVFNPFNALSKKNHQVIIELIKKGYITLKEDEENEDSNNG